MIRYTYLEFKNGPVRDMIKNYICTTLEDNRGNVARAARDLGMDRRNLHRLMQQYGIKKPEKRWTKKLIQEDACTPTG